MQKCKITRGIRTNAVNSCGLEISAAATGAVPAEGAGVGVLFLGGFGKGVDAGVTFSGRADDGGIESLGVS